MQGTTSRGVPETFANNTIYKLKIIIKQFLKRWKVNKSICLEQQRQKEGCMFPDVYQTV
jgi:hypothetical protein